MLPSLKIFSVNCAKEAAPILRKLLSSVAEIVRDVAVKGDEALFEYTAKFDGYELTAATVEVTAGGKKRSAGAGTAGRFGSY